MITNIEKTVFIKNVFSVVNCFLCFANKTETVQLMLKYNSSSRQDQLLVWNMVITVCLQVYADADADADALVTVLGWLGY